VSAPVLEVQGVRAGYVPDVDILQGVSLRVDAGEVVTVIGPNGAGKSTLAKAIAGLVRVRAGEVLVRGRPITNLPTHKVVGEGVAFIPQTGNIFTTLSIHENLRVGAHTLGREQAERIERAYRLFPELAERKDAKGRVLSGGQRQMLAIARALLTDPFLVMLDEPSAGLAPRMVQGAFAKVRELALAGVAVLMIEQNAKAALRISDRGYVLAEGRNQLDGPAADLLADPDVGRIYLGERRLSA
jgi:ABC-type branched-subunit amino acid transport system ATPase component